MVDQPGFIVTAVDGIDLPNADSTLGDPNAVGTTTHYPLNSVVPLSKLIPGQYQWLVQKGLISETTGNFGSGGGGASTWGAISMSKQPSFKAYNSNAVQINDPTNPTTLVFNDVSSSGGHNVGNHYNASTGVFTAPISGRYLFTFNMLTNPNFSSTDPGFVTVYITLNNSNIHLMCHNHNASWVMEGSSIILNMSANDYVSMRIVYGSGHYGAAYSFFSGCLLG